MDSNTDITSPKTQRRMWRRVWIVLALLILLTPVVTWFAVDQIGKNQWQEAQAVLHSKGEATSLEELDLPRWEAIPDEENFCALPSLIANDDGSASSDMAALSARLKIFPDASIERSLIRWGFGKPLLGMPGDIALLDLAAEKTAIAIDHEAMRAFGEDPGARLAIILQTVDDIMLELEQARDRPRAIWLPTFEDRRDSAAGDTFDIEFATYELAEELNRALSARATLALHQGDAETAVRSVEVGIRLAEANSNDPRVWAGLTSRTILETSLADVVTFLWDDRVRADNELLLRIQRALQRIDGEERAAWMVRSEMAYIIDLKHWTIENRKLAADRFANPPRLRDADSYTARMIQFAPEGWFLSNEAYLAEVYDSLFLAAARSGTYSDFLNAADRLDAHWTTLSASERIYFHWALFPLMTSYKRIFGRTAYIEAVRRQALITCALHRYALDHQGKFPADLKQLLPTYLSALPTDPIDDAPMRYSLTAEGSFLLYAIGLDKVDDGGQLTLEPDHPLDTRVNSIKYLGDWPWPVEPLRIDTTNEAGKD